MSEMGLNGKSVPLCVTQLERECDDEALSLVSEVSHPFS